MMIDSLFRILKMIFSSYFVGLTMICGIILSFYYPILVCKSETEFKKEYKIGKIIGYIYISGSLAVFIVVKLFE